MSEYDDDFDQAAAEGPRKRWDGRCEHGVYVGGCGADLMCGACEAGV